MKKLFAVALTVIFTAIFCFSQDVKEQEHREALHGMHHHRGPDRQRRVVAVVNRVDILHVPLARMLGAMPHVRGKVAEQEIQD